MTGDEISDRVVGDGVPNCAGSSGRMELFRQGLIGGHLTRGQAHERLPDFDLEVGAVQVQRERRGDAAGSVREDLLHHGGGTGRSLGQGGIGPGQAELFQGGGAVRIHEGQEADTATGERQQAFAKRRGVEAIGNFNTRRPWFCIRQG